MEPFKLKNESFPHFTIPSWPKVLPALSMGISTRNSGQSKGYFQTMNLALHVGDNKQDVIENRKNLANALGFSFDAWTSADQVHGSNIEIVTLDSRGKGRNELQDAIPKTDGIVTNIPDVLLTSFYADCVPLFFLDPIKKVVGLAHAGWKGTVLKIGEKMVKVMEASFKSNPKDIMIAIGPAIDQCCYEVNKQVIDPLQATFNFLTKDMILDKRNGHFDLDLKKINEEILINAGILQKNIEISNWCTSCNTDMFFSYRKEKGQTGRIASWIALRKDE